MGETRFMHALLHEKQLHDLGSSNLWNVIQEVSNPDGYISQEQTVNCLLEMFQLHKANAARLQPDEGRIGEPYIIYKITTNGTVQLHQ
jgi:hypothetical protein